MVQLDGQGDMCRQCRREYLNHIWILAPLPTIMILINCIHFQTYPLSCFQVLCDLSQLSELIFFVITIFQKHSLTQYIFYYLFSFMRSQRVVVSFYQNIYCSYLWIWISDSPTGYQLFWEKNHTMFYHSIRVHSTDCDTYLALKLYLLHE